MEEKLAGLGDSLISGSRLTALCEAFYRNCPNGRMSSHWPGTADEIKLRDFLSRHSGEQTEDAMAEFMRDLGIVPGESVVFEFQDEHGDWTPYSKEQRKQILANYVRKPTPNLVFDLKPAVG